MTISGLLFYTVKRGDTLNGIARRYGLSAARLQQINGISNADRIDEGEVIALAAEAVCKVDILLLDSFRNPIQNAKMRLNYCGKSEEYASGSDGLLPSIITDSPEDMVKISIARLDGSWKKITEVQSDWGNKLVTLVSPKVKFQTRTMPHPRDEWGNLKPEPKRQAKAPDNPASTAAQGTAHGDYGDGKGPKSEQKYDKNGFPVTSVTNDQPHFDFLGGYTGEKITEEDYQKAAKDIGCEIAFIKAVADVETGGHRGGFDSSHRPVILYERHVFARCTDPPNKYNEINPDISSKKRYKAASSANRKAIKAGKLSQNEIYGFSYARLAKAYALDESAALKACSWGKFQILGENYKDAGFLTVKSYVQAICISEREQLNALAKFIKSDRIKREAATNKDWKAFARRYNGRRYKEHKYDAKLKEAYNRYAK